MKLLTSCAALAIAFTTTSCETLTSNASAALNHSCHSVKKVSTLDGDQPIELKTGMCKEDVLALLGKPNYQYSICEEETWVYEDCSFIIDKAKETALNMVPCLGPTTSLLMGLKCKTEQAKAAVTFDCNGVVTSFAQVEESDEPCAK